MQEAVLQNLFLRGLQSEKLDRNSCDRWRNARLVLAQPGSDDPGARQRI